MAYGLKACSCHPLIDPKKPAPMARRVRRRQRTSAASLSSEDTHSGVSRLLGRTLAKFNQLKGNNTFDMFILLVWVQGSLFHIAAGSHPVQEAWGSQDNLYRGQIVASMLSRTIPTDSSCYNDSEKV